MLKIGECLIDAGMITEEQLKYALRKQSKGSKKKIGDILIELEYISRSEFNTFLTRHLASK